MRAKGHYVEQLLEMDDNLEIRGLFAVSRKDVIKEYRRGFFFTLMLSDKTGQIPAKFWGPPERERVEELYDALKMGSVLEVVGRVSSFRDEPYISLTVGKDPVHVVEEGGFNLDDFIDTTDRDIGEMMEELRALASRVEDPALSKLLDHFFSREELMERFKFMPCSKKYHHAYIGGLLEHTLNVTKIAAATGENYEGVDMDMLITASILHDLGKMDEYSVTGIIDFSTRGTMLGQVYLCHNMVEELLSKCPVEKEAEMKLIHIVLSHQGAADRATPVRPMIPEAVILGHADQLDSKTKAMLEVRAENMEIEEDFVYVPRRDIMSNVYLR